MKVVIQRVKKASVKVNDQLINKIDKGLLVFVGISKDDEASDLNYIVKKTLNLRIFNDENNIMNKSIIDIKGEILSISQFTLQADTKSGNRPSYLRAMSGDNSIKLYNKFNEELNKEIKTYPGSFGSDMDISLVNDGPVTIVIDSKNK